MSAADKESLTLATNRYYTHSGRSMSLGNSASVHFTIGRSNSIQGSTSESRDFSSTYPNSMNPYTDWW